MSDRPDADEDAPAIALTGCLLAIFGLSLGGMYRPDVYAEGEKPGPPYIILALIVIVLTFFAYYIIFWPA